jgi:hypothetical protein
LVPDSQGKTKVPKEWVSLHYLMQNQDLFEENVPFNVTMRPHDSRDGECDLKL